MGANEAWNKFKESGNINDYLNYRKELESLTGVLNPAQRNVVGADNENSNKWYRNPRGGLWGK